MKTLTKSLLALGVALSFTACGGGSVGDILDSTDPTDYTDTNDYTNTNDYNDYNDYTDNTNTGTDANSLSVYSLAGYAIVGTDDSYIAFCNDGSSYAYLNFRGQHTGSYSVVYGTKVDFYDNDGGSYAIETGNGYFEVGYSYYVNDVSHSITVSYITSSGC